MNGNSVLLFMKPGAQKINSAQRSVRIGRRLAVALSGAVVLIAGCTSTASVYPQLSKTAAATEAEISEGDQPSVTVGPSAAKSQLTIWEDFRCSACRRFEQTFHSTIRRLQDSGQLKSEYHLVTSIDDKVGGIGSLAAANAALCAQDAGKFLEYHDVLYANQPDEADDRFADPQFLVQLAGQMNGLVTESFIECVHTGSHDTVVDQSHSSFIGEQYRGTPTVFLNGKNLSDDPNAPSTPQQLEQVIMDANNGK
ncbi:thioredoxin domain-containing protein [Nocardia colli]|uniref:Thioredoxin domain-containing protein n=1 Tax=Nocardia colli TaxID=2545717 RepID=A0A5N0EBT2_9NOCA|nr:thioredoxin domain-containing protein [Nocardia colli]KAA8886250.1 thioredoxin domain-containing protein [Nocardia colli]